jgi:hypothetical protein
MMSKQFATTVPISGIPVFGILKNSVPLNIPDNTNIFIAIAQFFSI